MYKDRHARTEQKCEWCESLFMARVERVSAGQGRFCSRCCANNWQRDTAKKVRGFENGKKYWDGKKWIIAWLDENGKQHNTTYANWWWTLHIGEIPGGFVVTYKDRNQKNIDSSNFELIKKGRIWVENGKGNKGRTGKIWTPEQRIRIGNQRRKNWDDGVYNSVHIGENNHNWKGGKSKETYPSEFYEIREFVLDRDNYQCQVCGKGLHTKKFAHVHHRDGNKQNNDQNNLLSLCIFCHSKVHSTSSTSPVIMALRSELYQ